MKAAIYCRISQDSTGEGLGVARQMQDCKELAAQLGWEIEEAFVDNDVSATSGKPRPEYQRMLGALRSGRANAIVCWHPDRLYRRATDLGELVQVCKDHGVHVATVNAGNVDLTTPSGRLVAGLLAQVATFEGEHKAERWKRSHRQAREAGRMPGYGHRMFGWTREGELIPLEAAVIRRAVRDLLAGKSLRAICRDLNEDGVKTTRGNDWQPAAMRNLLRNPRLAGHSMMAGQIVGVGDWQPILDNETWETVRAFLTARYRPPPVRVSLLNGLIHCGICEARLITGSHKSGVRAYRCVRRPDAPTACGGVIVNAEPVEEIVEGVARRYLDNPKIRKAFVELRTDQTHLLTEIDAAELRLAEIQVLIEEGEIKSIDLLVRAADKVKDHIASLQEKLATTVHADLPPVGMPWPEDLVRRRRLIDLVVARVWLDRSPIRGGTFDPGRVRVDPTDLVTG